MHFPPHVLEERLRVEHVIVTIKDVAQRAGVSPKTVSRVLNNETHVRPQLRETVLRVIEELNYKPNMFARGLSSARSYLIGLFIYDPYWSGYATDIQLGALRRCRELGYHLVIEPIDPFMEGAAEQVVDGVAGLRLDGVILPPPLCTFEPLLSRIEEMGMPYVRISPGQDMDRSALVEIDEFAAAHDMTRHLIELGHRDIGFVEGIPTHAAAARRYAGFEAAMGEAGLTVNRDWVLPGLFTFQSGFAAADELLSRKGPLPTALFCANDDMALGAVSAARKHGLEAPADLSIVGFDDAPAARFSWPPITTMRQPVSDMVASAVDMLVDPKYRRDARKDGLKPAPRLELPFALVQRQSAAAP